MCAYPLDPTGVAGGRVNRVSRYCFRWRQGCKYLRTLDVLSFILFPLSQHDAQGFFWVVCSRSKAEWSGTKNKLTRRLVWVKRLSKKREGGCYWVRVQCLPDLVILRKRSFTMLRLVSALLIRTTSFVALSQCQHQLNADASRQIMPADTPRHRSSG